MEKILIIGGGIIGLSTGWQLAKKGFDVEILERSKAGGSASYAAAGMLAPQAEMGFEDIEAAVQVVAPVRESLRFAPGLEAMRTAKKHIHLEAFMITDDEVGRSFHDLLVQKRKERLVVQLRPSGQA